MELTPSQRKAVEHKDGPLLILAGPGSGKTRVITSRICRLVEKGVAPWNICAITFTNKASQEMKERIIRSGIRSGAHISTFHSLCVQLLRRYAQQAGIHPNFSIYDDSDQSKCVKAATKDVGADSTNFTPNAALSTISKWKNDLELPSDIRDRADGFRLKLLARIYDRYQQILETNNALDFDDLLVKAAFLLKNNPDVRQELNDRFHYLLVDEYQDTNHAQYQIAKGLALGHGNICVTGDPDQSIYRWRGADIGNILAFEKDYPNAMVVRLEENFRSTATILAVADRLIAANRKRKEKRLVPTIPDGQAVEIQGYGDDEEEAVAVAQRVKALIEKGEDPGEISVFYRVNSMSRKLEEAFIRERVAYQVVRGVEFYGRREIRDMMAYLKVLANPQDEVSFMRIVNTPPRGLGDTTLDKVSAFAQERKVSVYHAAAGATGIAGIAHATQVKLQGFVAMMENFRTGIDGPVAPLMERVFKESGLERALGKGKDEEGSARDNVVELINGAAVYDSNTEKPSLVDYLQQIALFSDADAYDVNAKKVALMTLHAAKGLEFDHVFIIGAEEGILPHERSANNEDELEEERRLMFVGITRAKRGLEISFARHRQTRGQINRTIPSQFLYETGVEIKAPQDEWSMGTGQRPGMAARAPIGELTYERFDGDIADESLFRQGELVRHAKFGLGRVMSFMAMGESSTVTIKFNIGQTKTLMLKYANLERVEQ
jgi:DNA helicase II / ATP-dependent DNA helicase PcrA